MSMHQVQPGKVETGTTKAVISGWSYFSATLAHADQHYSSALNNNSTAASK